MGTTSTETRGRKPRLHDTVNGPRWRVRYRSGGTETSETFIREADAKIFAGFLNSDPKTGVLDALAWLESKKQDREDLTFAQWFDRYVDELTGVTPRTRADYRSMSKRHLTSIHHLPLPLVTRSHVARIVNDLDNRDVSAKTIKNLVHMLSSCMAVAVDEELIPRNPCKRIKLPKPSEDVVDARFLTHEEFARLIVEIPAHYQPLVALLVGTGLRWSEATALRPGDVALEHGTIRVERAWKWAGAGKGWAIGPPKSPKSRRTVNAAVLALKAVWPLPDTEYLFTTPTGQVVRHNNFYNRVWLPAIGRAGLQGTRIHDLRHTHASWLISEGVSLEAVQDQLGHESIITTRKTYGRLLPAVGVAVGKVASAGLLRALPDGMQLGATTVQAIDAA